jgi:hypothetical protein
MAQANKEREVRFIGSARPARYDSETAAAIDAEAAKSK